MGYAAHLRCARKGFGYFSTRAAEATPSRLTAEQGRYSAAAANATVQRLAERGAGHTNGVELNFDLALAAAGLTKRLGSRSVLGVS